jgi:prephenate dehydratase
LDHCLSKKVYRILEHGNIEAKEMNNKERIRVSFQGTPGSFSSMAARAIYGERFDGVSTTRFRDIFELVKNQQVDFGIVPIENAIAGSVHENYDLLSEYNCSIVAETYIPVQIHLLATDAEAEITKVFSHPKALEQCSTFLEMHPSIETVAWSDTAGAAEHVATLGQPGLAALASEEAALLNGLQIIKRAAQNHPKNATRFVALAREPVQMPNLTKCSLIVYLAHKPGSLNSMLGEIANLNLNLTKIESCPILGSPFSYLFHVDVEGSESQSSSLMQLPDRISSISENVKILGFYQSSPLHL